MIEHRLKQQLNEVAQRANKVNKVILFGSRAIGDNMEKSDIDLAFVAPNMTRYEWTEFTFALGEELDTLLFLDLIKYEDAPKELRDEIMKNGKILYSLESNSDMKTS